MGPAAGDATMRRALWISGLAALVWACGGDPPPTAGTTETDVTDVAGTVDVTEEVTVSDPGPVEDVPEPTPDVVEPEVLPIEDVAPEIVDVVPEEDIIVEDPDLFAVGTSPRSRSRSRPRYLRALRKPGRRKRRRR